MRPPIFREQGERGATGDEGRVDAEVGGVLVATGFQLLEFSTFSFGLALAWFWFVGWGRF